MSDSFYLVAASVVPQYAPGVLQGEHGGEVLRGREQDQWAADEDQAGDGADRAEGADTGDAADQGGGKVPTSRAARPAETRPGGW